MKALTIVLLLAAEIAAAQVSETEEYSAPRFLSGKIPEQPPLAAAGGGTVVELDVAASGIVTDAIALDQAEPFTETIQEASRLWRYRAAEVDGAAIRSKALVIGVFRPPVLMGSALPDRQSVRAPADSIPYPTAIPVPEYPPNALYEGVAVVEVAIDETGVVTDARMVSAEAGYDAASLDAAMRFRFRPARHDSRAMPSFALILFGFRQPLTTPTLPPR